MTPRPQNWLFDAGPQRSKVIGVTLFSAACALGSSWAAWDIWLTMGLSPADGNQLSPWQARLAMALFVGGLGWSFFGGMLIYLRCYVSRILAVDAETVELLRLWPGPPLRLGARDGALTQAHAGQFRGRMAVSVSAPWTSLRLPGQRWPLIIDDQGVWNPAATRPKWLR